MFGDEIMDKINRLSKAKKYEDLFTTNEVDIVCTPAGKVLNMERFNKFLSNIENKTSDSIKLMKCNVAGQSEVVFTYYENSIITCIYYAIDIYSKKLITTKYTGTSIFNEYTLKYVNYHLLDSSGNNIFTLLTYSNNPKKKS